MTNVLPSIPEIHVFALILASKLGHVANQGQHENTQVHAMILDVWMQLLQIMFAVL